MKVANGFGIKKKKKKRIFDGATHLIQGIKFVIDLNVQHLGGREVVIATKWLSTLDKINWDFKLLTMKFLYLGKRVMLQGLQPNGSTFLEGDRLFSGTTIK